MRRYFLLALLVLTACATPQERCISNATQEIRIMDKLISTTQANVARGYALETENYFETESQVCGNIDGDDVYCDVPVANSRQVPKAIDLDVEKTKLISLKKRRAEMARLADATIAQCRAQFPEA